MTLGAHELKKGQIVVLDYTTCNVYVLPMERLKKSEEIESRLVEIGFRLDEIEWMHKP